ncbi:hypothetical protein [Novipirellula aureliae]|uniref:hypothetical protein n=1 Tax=Novipirellula aureliae TaxID=2527966 RepID=UPI0011B765EE|nr:hypothetical protein [Novipirellula aureliae]
MPCVLSAWRLGESNLDLSILHGIALGSLCGRAKGGVTVLKELPLPLIKLSGLEPKWIADIRNGYLASLWKITTANPATVVRTPG